MATPSLNVNRSDSPLARINSLPLVQGALVATLILQLPIVLRRAINWDEFYHYSQVEKLARGALTEPLQTLYTRAFVWVPELPGTGVDHVVLIRLFMLACELVTIFAIIGIASRFTNRATAILCALAYVSSSFVFKHGTSFRFDPPAAALLMTSAYVLLRRGWDIRSILIAGGLIGTSLVLTIKTVLYVPVFAGIAWLCWVECGRKREDLVRVAGLAVASVAAAAIIYLIHSSTLGSDSNSEARQLVSRAGASMFALGNPLYWKVAISAALGAPLVAAAVVAAPFFIWRGNRPTADKVALIGMWLPLTTLLFYHNTAPYYYVYMLPPVVVAAGPALSVLAQRYGEAVIAALLFACAAVTLAREPESPIEKQKQILEQADRMFPGGVAYFDDNAMLGTFPKANVFMTPWNVEHYLAGRLPNMLDTMAQRPVPLLLKNSPVFDDALNSRKAVPWFLPQDLVAMRETFIPLWGPFWIAGKAMPPGAGPVTWNVRVPGPYSARDGVLTVDGRLVRPGEIIRLERGKHVIAGGPQASRLIWGKNLRIPAEPPPNEPYFMPF